MTRWMRGTGGSIALVWLWIGGWGLGFGGLAEIFVDPSGETLDIWPAEMAIPGGVGGVVFAALLRLNEGRRSFDEVPLARFALWGVVTGLALGALSLATGGPIPFDLAPLEMMALAAALGATAGTGSAVFFRIVATRQRPAVARHTG